MEQPAWKTKKTEEATNPFEDHQIPATTPRDLDMVKYPKTPKNSPTLNLQLILKISRDF